ncbi:hypothetical protein HC928_18780 [bacterium]|nr:hypothetical protein [bacterium]
MLPSQLQAFQDEKHQPFLWGAADGRATTAALLVHGYPGTPAEMRPTARILTDNNIAARGMLLPGFGPQIETLAERTVSDWASAVERELRDLQAAYEQVYVVGAFHWALPWRCRSRPAAPHRLMG